MLARAPVRFHRRNKKLIQAHNTLSSFKILTLDDPYKRAVKIFSIVLSNDGCFKWRHVALCLSLEHQHELFAR